MTNQYYAKIFLVTTLGEYRAQCVYEEKSCNLDFKVIHGDQ